MGSARILTEMFLSEATLEFPDSEIAAVTRMIQSNERAGRIPRGASENWPIVQAGHRGSGQKPAPKAPAAKPVAKVPSGPPKGDLSGRGVPPESSLRSGEPSRGLSHDPPRALKKKYAKQDDGKPQDASDDDGEGSTPKPSALKRAYSRIHGRDPETGFPEPRAASFKVHGGPSDKAHTFNEPPKKLVGQRPEDEPLFNVPGVTDQPVPDDDEDDDRLAMVKGNFRRFKRAAPRNTPNLHAPGFSPEQDAWDRFAGKAGFREPEKPAPAPGKRQGRLSRLFRGRRDDGI